MTSYNIVSTPPIGLSRLSQSAVLPTPLWSENIGSVYSASQHAIAVTLGTNNKPTTRFSQNIDRLLSIQATALKKQAIFLFNKLDLTWQTIVTQRMNERTETNGTLALLTEYVIAYENYKGLNQKGKKLFLEQDGWEGCIADSDHISNLCHTIYYYIQLSESEQSGFREANLRWKILANNAIDQVQIRDQIYSFLNREF